MSESNTSQRDQLWRDLNRGTGRTQRMLESVIESIREGKTLIRVFGYSHDYSIRLMSRLLSMLDQAKIAVARTDSNGRLQTKDGCIVEFHSMKKDLREIDRGIGPVTNFFDHFRGNT